MQVSINVKFSNFCNDPFREHDAMFLDFDNVASQQALDSLIEKYEGKTSAEVSKVLKFHSHEGFDLDVPVDSFLSNETNSDVSVEDIQDMNHCINLWRLVQEKKDDDLRRHIHWASENGGLAVHVSFDGTRRTIASTKEKEHADVLAEFKPGDVVTPALFYIQQVINKSLSNNIEARTLWDSRQKAMHLHFVPVNLRGALWLQFAQAFTRSKKFERCKECNKSFEVSLEAARTNRQFCSVRCKLQAYRKRKKKALKMKKKGHSVRQIAKELGSDIDTVRGWLAQEK